jgi:Ca2+-binding EF-hand superfamily protein
MSKIDTIRRLGYVLLTFFVASCAQTPPPKVEIETSSPTYTTIYDAFSRYDTNSDNLLDRHEFHQFQQDPEIVAFRERIPEAARSRPLLFDEIDEDGDERISLNEITVIAEGSIPKIE